MYGPARTLIAHRPGHVPPDPLQSHMHHFSAGQTLRTYHRSLQMHLNKTLQTNVTEADRHRSLQTNVTLQKSQMHFNKDEVSDSNRKRAAVESHPQTMSLVGVILRHHLQVMTSQMGI